MEKHEEIKKLREEITRLRVRLNELDEESNTEPVTEVCGHDFILDNLKKFGKQYNQLGRSALAGYHNDYWYTTTIEPSKINSFLEDSVPVKEFLTIFCIDGVWDALVHAFNGEFNLITKDAYRILETNKFIENNNLTIKGFTSYVVLGHLIFNMTKKLPVEKAISIFKVAYEITGIEYGEYLPYTGNDFLNNIKGHEKYNDLLAQGITEHDICEYIRLINVEVTKKE